ncbi:MAG TPA: acyl-CoA dehydrogenase family protein [Azospirillaceae bacterium]|nr:acyl-CoA dehydrogenase family protein [Azospirillaceae bacterium]
MDFTLSEDQVLLQDSVRRFVAERYGFDARRAIVAGPDGFSRAHWRTMAELGWLMLPFDEADGGLGGGGVEIMLVAEQFGRGLVVEPFLTSCIMAGDLIARLGTPDQKGRLLPPIMDGGLLATVAATEPQSRFDLGAVATRAERRDGGWVLDGAKSVVLHGPSAGLFVVPARTAEGITLFLVPGDAAGLTRRDYPLVDGWRASDVRLEQVRVDDGARLGAAGAGLAPLQAMADRAILALGAEAVGAMEVLLWSTVEYARTRVQFDQPIGRFQVVQHRLVDMYVEYEQTKSLLLLAAMRLGEGGTAAASAASALKAQVGRAGRFIGQQAVQLHGGMGMTDELPVGHYFKRLTAIDALFGNVDFHLERFASLS